MHEIPYLTRLTVPSCTVLYGTTPTTGPPDDDPSHGKKGVAAHAAQEIVRYCTVEGYLRRQVPSVPHRTRTAEQARDGKTLASKSPWEYRMLFTSTAFLFWFYGALWDRSRRLCCVPQILRSGPGLGGGIPSPPLPSSPFAAPLCSAPLHYTPLLRPTVSGSARRDPRHRDDGSTSRCMVWYCIVQ